MGGGGDIMASMTANAAYTNHTETHEAEVTRDGKEMEYVKQGVCPTHPDIGMCECWIFLAHVFFVGYALTTRSPS